MGLIYCVLVSLWTLVNAGISYAFNKINHVLISRLWTFSVPHTSVCLIPLDTDDRYIHMITGKYVLTLLFVPGIMLFSPIRYGVAVKNVQYPYKI